MTNGIITMIKTKKDRRSISFGRVSMACKRSQIVATVRTSASNTKRPEPGGALVSVIGFSTSAGIPVSKYIGGPRRREVARAYAFHLKKRSLAYMGPLTNPLAYSLPNPRTKQRTWRDFPLLCLHDDQKSDNHCSSSRDDWHKRTPQHFFRSPYLRDLLSNADTLSAGKADGSHTNAGSAGVHSRNRSRHRQHRQPPG